MKEIEVIAIYCIIDDILKNLGWEDDRQAKMSSSEVLIPIPIMHSPYNVL